MYAIFEDGGKQYKVQQGDRLLVERRDLAESQSELVFDKVLMLGEGEAAKIGAPFLSGAKVTAKVSGEVKTAKAVTIKHRRRKGYKLKRGHRQQMMRVEIDAISG